MGFKHQDKKIKQEKNLRIVHTILKGWFNIRENTLEPSRTTKHVQLKENYLTKIEYILEWNSLGKSVKRPFCRTVSILQVYFTYNLLGPWISFYRKSKMIVKRKPNYEKGWFHNWPMIISHRLYAFHFTNDDFPL